VIGLKPPGIPFDAGFKEGTVESVRKTLEDAGCKIYTIREESE
jgi:hypothetical protein